MKTTQQLIELQRSITQGEWKAFGCAVYTNSAATYGGDAPVASAFTDPTGDRMPTDNEIDNATAIALVPELLAEVISLRAALRGCAEMLDAETLGGEPLDIARAALAGDK